MASAKKPRAKKRAAAPREMPTVAPDEIEPDVIHQATEPARPGTGIEIRRFARGHELVIADFTALRAAAGQAGIPADGFLAAAMLQRERFLLGGAPWMTGVSFDATTRQQCVLRCKSVEVLTAIEAAYRSRCATTASLAEAIPKLDADFLEGQFFGWD